MTDSLTILYTHQLRGELALLPRLQTFLRRLRGEHAVGNPVLLFDLGDSCTPDVFPCALTGGRSSLIALDAMGYNAANVDGALSDEDRIKLEAGHLRMGLVDSAHPFTIQDILCVVMSTLIEPAVTRLIVDLCPSSKIELIEQTLHLTGVEAGEVGLARIEWHDDLPQLVAAGIFALQAETLPDPVIAGTIDFILDEARYTQKRRGDV